MKHKILLLYSWFVRTLLFFLPDIPFLMRFRGYLYGLGMKECGKDFQVTHSSILNGLELLTVGNNVYIANNSNIIANGEIFIGDKVMLAPQVIISSGNHQYDGDSYRFMESKKEDVSIGKGVWVGANSTITGGVIIPERSIVGANSLVLPSLPTTEHALYAGVPARLIKML